MEIKENLINTKLSELNERLMLDPEESANGLVRIVLSLVNTLKELMELQSLRKIEKGELSDIQIEKIGTTFLALDEKITELREHFDLSPEDLDIDLNKYITIK